MKKTIGFLLYGHGGYYNKGCEAIVRSTVSILKNEFNTAKIMLASYAYQEDKASKYGMVDQYLPHANRYLSWGHLAGGILGRLGQPEAADYFRYLWLSKALPKADLFCSIGGDNYCYEEPLAFYKFNEIIRRAGKRNIFWGASVEPEKITARMLEDLKGFDLITARESLTYEALCSKGLTNVSLYPDPAFALKRENIALPMGFVEGNTIGLNLSPLSLRYSTATGIVKKNVRNFIRYLIKETDFTIALLPHVVDGKPDSPQNDLLVLNEIYKEFQESGRLLMIDYHHNASQLKDIIAQCRFFIGARTHATIAAYSTAVPTLAIGYSVKASGIARDIFGSEEGMVVPVQSLENQNELINAFEKLKEREAETRDHLRAFMPEYIKKAIMAGEEIKRLIERKN